MEVEGMLPYKNVPRLFNTETQRHGDFPFLTTDSVTWHKNIKGSYERVAELLAPMSTVFSRPPDTKRKNYHFSVSLCLCVKSFLVTGEAHYRKL